MNRINTVGLLCCTTLAGLSVSTAVVAQSESRRGAAQTKGSSESATAAGTKILEEILVTAQKRAENVQDVPIAVAIVSSEQLAQQNIVTTSDLVQSVPALTVTNFGVFQVRSLGTQGFGKSAEQSVSVVLDGVPMPRPLAYNLANSLFDVDHVEVLSGPQGTLFGKNASAGVINIVTKAPRLQEFEAIAHLDAGDHELVNAQAVLNIPVGDTAAFRVGGHYNSQGHIVYNRLFNKWDHSSDTGVRARFLWEPADTLRINLTGDFQELRSNGVNGQADFAGVGVFRSVPPGVPLEATLASCGIVAGSENNDVCGDSLYDPNVKRGDVYGSQRRGGSAQIDWDFAEGYTLTSVSAYRDDVTGDFDVDGEFAGGFGDTLPTNILQRNNFPTSLKMFSQELRVQSPADDQINFVAGLYYSKIRAHDHIDQAGAFGLPLGGLEFRRVNDVYNRATNSAAFGQVNFDVTPELRLLAGARVTRDRLRTFTINSFPAEVPNGPFLYTGNSGFFSLYPINSCTIAGGNPDDPATCPAGTSLTDPARLSETGYTWKVGAQYDINPQTMVYATFTRGYKGPFINDQASAPIVAPLTVKSEKPDAYEIGLKMTLLDRVNMNIALFHTKTKDFQTTVYVPPEVSGGAVASFFQGNAPYAVTSGVDIGLIGNITDNLSFNASLLYNDAHFNDGFLVPCTSETGTCEALDQLPYAPKWKGSLAGEYTVDFSDRIQGYLQSDFSYSSSAPFVSTPDGFESGARYVLGARTGLRFDGDKWGVAVFCRNCLDKRYPTVITQDGFATSDGGTAPDGTVATLHYLGLSSYRVVGLSLDGRF